MAKKISFLDIIKFIIFTILSISSVFATEYSFQADLKISTEYEFENFVEGGGVANLLIEAKVRKNSGSWSDWKEVGRTDELGILDETVDINGGRTSNVSVRLRAVFSNETYRLKRNSSTQKIEFFSSVFDDEQLFFGTLDLKDLLTSGLPDLEDRSNAEHNLQDDYNHFLIWYKTDYLLKQYEAKIGPWPRRFPVLDIKVMDSEDFYEEGNISNANGSRIKLFNTTAKTLSHEMGHWIAANDSSSLVGNIPRYCKDYQPTEFPYNSPPYNYLEPTDLSSCVHTLSSYERTNVAVSEGFAHFVSSYLLGEERGIENICNTGELGKEYINASMGNFDLANRSMNIRDLLCELADDKENKESFLHLWPTSDDHLFYENDLPIEYSSAFASNEEYIYTLRYPNQIMRRNFERNSNFESFVNLPENNKLKNNKLRASSNAICALTYGRSLANERIICYSESSDIKDIKSLNKVTDELFPLSRRDVSRVFNFEYSNPLQDFAVSKTGVYTLFNNQIRYQAFTDPDTIHFISVGSLLENRFRNIAIDNSDEKLILSSTNAAMTCKLEQSNSSGSFFCLRDPQLIGQSDDSQGYVRGDAERVYFDSISRIKVMNETIHFTDTYGVSSYDPETKKLSQVLGAGRDNVFENNMTLRSYGIRVNPSSTTVPTAFATNGKYSIVFGSLTRYKEDGLEQRSPSTKSFSFFDKLYIDAVEDQINEFLHQYYLGVIHVDNETRLNSEVYCGEDKVSIDPAELIHLFLDNPLNNNYREFKELLPLDSESDEFKLVERIAYTRLGGNSKECPDYRKEVGPPRQINFEPEYIKTDIKLNHDRIIFYAVEKNYEPMRRDLKGEHIECSHSNTKE